MSSTPISLYLDLEPGQVADLEVVARASLAFAAAVKDLAYVIDPSLELRIELASGTEGSLSLNSLLKSIRGKEGEAITLAAIALVILNWFAGHALDAFDPRTQQDLNAKAIQEQLGKEAVGYFKEEKSHVDLTVDIDPARSFQRLNDAFDDAAQIISDHAGSAAHQYLQSTHVLPTSY